MRKIVYYVADDGTQFNDEQACVVYERSIDQKRKEINGAIATLREHCKNTTCHDCFAGKSYYGYCAFKVNDPLEWEMKME